MAKWHNRAAILAEFTNALSKKPAGEDFAIDCSSSDECFSDEDVSLNPRVPVIQPQSLSTSTQFPPKIQAEVRKAQINDSLKNQHDKDHPRPSVSDDKYLAPNKKEPITPQKLPGERTPVNKVSGYVKANLCNAEGLSPVCPPNDTSKTKNKINTKEPRLFPSNEKRFQGEASSHSSEANVNVFEPQSPILGWRRTMAWSSLHIKAKKTKVTTHSPMVGSHKVPKRKLAVSDIASVKRQIISEDETVQVNCSFNVGTKANKEEQRSSNLDGKQYSNSDVNLNTRAGMLNDVCASEPHRYEREFKVSQEANQSQSTNSYCIIQPDGCRWEQSLLDQANRHSIQQIFQRSDESKSNSSISNGVLQPSASCDISSIQGEPELGDDHQASQNIVVTSEEPDSQVGYNIEMPLSPQKHSLDGTDMSENIDSSGPQVSHELSVQEPEGSAKSGFDWVKHLQSPQKLTSNDTIADGVESCKKKLIKDGQAERLKYLLVSWRSDISTWSHEYSLTTLHGTSQRQSSPLPFSVLHPADTVSRVVKVQPQERLYAVKSLRSPTVRNLQDLLIEDSSSTPGTPPHKVVQKYLELKLLEVGGLLPNNAALCEVIDSNVEGFQTSGSVKVEISEGKSAVKTEKKFLVFFAVNEHNVTNLCKLDSAKIYAPWQNLSVPGHDIPALFATYFKFTPREKRPPPLQPGHRKAVFTWTCKCSDMIAPVSLCSVQSCSFLWMSHAQTGHTHLLSQNSGFTTIKDTPETPPQNGRLRAGTILEALEKCGGVSTLPVSITIRIHRIITRRKTSMAVDSWELVGQDAAGQFCLVKIPNRPLAQDFRKIFSDPNGCSDTYTFTHLTISQRLTNTQDPGLFSLLTSLHKAYQSTVLRDPHLQLLIQDLVSRPPQTFCYVLIASLGVTRALHNEEKVTLPIDLPHWSLQEAQTVACDGQRGNISVFALYKSSCSLFVMCHMSYHKKSSILFSRVKETKSNVKEDSKPQVNILASRVQLVGGAVHSWIPESGTVMVPVILRDVLVWHGSVVVDDYSSVEPEKEGRTKVDLLSLSEVLSPLSMQTQQDCLTLVSGTIINIDEEKAAIYLTCGNCKSDKVQEAEDGLVDCLWCDQRSALPNKAYSLEVWLDCGNNLQHAAVKVKLSQKTIQNLLSPSCESQEEEYSVTSLLGRQVGPMACVLLELEQPSHYSTCTYNLAELPL